MSNNSQENTPSIRNPQTPILFVDDDKITHKIIKRHLSEWNIFHAFSGREALAAIEKENILIVISDVNMPEMDGLELLKTIKSENPTIQIIIATASSELDILIEALNSGADDFILKPIKKELLEHLLEISVNKVNRWRSLMQELFQTAQEK